MTCRAVIIGDAQVLAHNARRLDLQCGYDIVRIGEQIPPQYNDPTIFHLNNVSGHIEPGIESGVAGKAAAQYIEAAVELCAAGRGADAGAGLEALGLGVRRATRR